MAKIGSEFLKEFDQFEKAMFFKSSKRLFIFILGLAMIVGLSIGLYLLKFPVFMVYLILFLLLVPVCIYGMGQDQELKNYILHYLTVKERSYQTSFDHREEDLTYEDFKVAAAAKETETDQG